MKRFRSRLGSIAIGVVVVGAAGGCARNRDIDGAVYGSVGLGGGGKFSATVDVGGSTGAGNGASQTVDLNGPDCEIAGSWGSGLEIGVGAGCSVGMRWTA